MGFLNIYLLGGLVLLGAPVLVHLMMRQKPRRLSFPAFRFLRQRSLINRRKMRLQHLLLLLLRMAVLAALILAVAQPTALLPRAFARWLHLEGPRPAAAVFVFDVSYSMDYRVGDRSRLDDARQRALDLLHDLPSDSRVAVLDTGEEGGDDADDDWIGTPAQVRDWIEAPAQGGSRIKLQPVRAPLVREIERAAAMLDNAGKDEDWTPASRRLYVFSDRTKTSWDAGAAKDFHLPAGVQASFIDLGVDSPANLSIDKVEVRPRVVPPGGEVTVHVEVRAVGGPFDHFNAKLLCRLDRDGSPATLLVKPSADFKLTAPTPVRPPDAPEGVVTEAHQVVVEFGGADGQPFRDDLPHDNTRYATFFARDNRVLVLDDDPDPAGDLKKKPGVFWYAALEAYKKSHPEGYHCDLRPAADAAKLRLKDLEPYRVVCLFQNAKPLPDDFCTALEEYVNNGGGVAIVPPTAPLAGDGLQQWNAALDSHGLLPARLRGLIDVKEGKRIYWDDFRDDHPLTKPFYDWRRGANPDFADETLRPFVKRYWEVDVDKDKSLVVSTYQDDKNSPALVELKRGEEDKADKRGRVLLFTTRLDRRPEDPSDPDWNNFYDGSFGLVLINEACKYLAGDSSREDPNFICGAPVVLPLPASAPRGVYRLNAPEQRLSESERSITVDAKDSALQIRAASVPGQYSVFDPNGKLFTAFSLNVSSDESQLERLPAADVEKVLGPGSVLTAQPGVSLNGPLRERAAAATTAEPPWEPLPLLPLLMILTLLFLTFEGLLANRFYERPSPAAAGGPEGEQAAS